MIPCNDVQEKVARVDPLSEDERHHASACQSCASVIAEFSLLEAALNALAAGAVPSGFADRVMARVQAEGDATAATPGRWLHLAFACAAGGFGLFNVAAFLARVLIASIAFGSTP
jgi:anti-sigma factor RsiW